MKKQAPFHYGAITVFLQEKMGNQKPHQHNAAKDNPIVAENFKVMTSNITKQETNAVQADKICQNHRKQECKPLHSRKMTAVLYKL